MTITEGLKPYFKLAALLGALSMIFDTWLSAKFGWTISIDMAGIFGLVSLASGVLIVIAAAFYRSGNIPLAKGIAAAWVPVFAFNVMSNMGVATASRMTDVQQASVQQTKFTAAQDSVKESAANLQLWTAQLATLKASNAWVASVTAESLRGQLAELQAAADRESRRGGCGSKCEAIKAQVRDVQSRIGAAEQRDDLTKRIEATQRLVDKHRTAAASTDAGVSQAQNQSTFFGKLMRASLYSSPDAQDIAVANEGMGMFTALVLALVSALLTYVGAYPHLQQIRATLGVPDPAPTDETAAPAHPAIDQRTVPPVEHRHTREVMQPMVIQNNAKFDALIAAMRDRGLVAA